MDERTTGKSKSEDLSSPNSSRPPVLIFMVEAGSRYSRLLCFDQRCRLYGAPGRNHREQGAIGHWTRAYVSEEKSITVKHVALSVS